MKPGYTLEMPSSPGTFMLICSDNDYNPEEVVITLEDGVLHTESRIGSMGLRFLHYGLNCVRWSIEPVK